MCIGVLETGRLMTRAARCGTRERPGWGTREVRCGKGQVGSRVCDAVFGSHGGEAALFNTPELLMTATGKANHHRSKLILVLRFQHR